jgi:hypothetical protein
MDGFKLDGNGFEHLGQLIPKWQVVYGDGPGQGKLVCQLLKRREPNLLAVKNCTARD